jgi:hypothetical protein
VDRNTDDVDDFFKAYPDAIRDIAVSLRSTIRSAIPDATEMLDRADRVVGYGIGAGYSGLICTIIPSKTGVKLGIVGGANLADPKGLLEGPGKRHRYVQFTRTSDLGRAGVRPLIKAARDVVKTKQGH